MSYQNDRSRLHLALGRLEAIATAVSVADEQDQRDYLAKLIRHWATELQTYLDMTKGSAR